MWKREIGTKGAVVVATRLKERYQKEVVPRLRTRFAYRNVMQVPRGERVGGNVNRGLKEQLIFPEIDYDKVEKIRGMDITIVTTARTDEEARELLRLLRLPPREGRQAGEDG